MAIKVSVGLVRWEVLAELLYHNFYYVTLLWKKNKNFWLVLGLALDKLVKIFCPKF